MKHIKLFEAFEGKNILDSDFIVNTLNDIKKEAFPKIQTYYDTRDKKIYPKKNPTHERIEFEWDPKKLQLTVEIKPEEAYSRFGLSKEEARQNLEDDMPMFGESMSWILREATKRIEEKGIPLERGDDTSSGFKLISTYKFSDMIKKRYLLLVSK
jgi:hypothetical protein